MTPPGSWDDGAESPALPTQIKWPVENFRYASPDDELTQQPAFRTRIGRGGRQWIDRRGLPQSFAKQSMTEEQAERSKYDQDDEDEYPTIEVDPFGTEPIRFRANIVSERYAPVASSPNSRPGSRPNPASLPAQTYQHA
jgi:enhancer of polycomb-like protein